MIIVRKSGNRGITQTDWLRSYHTFSFGNYYDSEFMGFSHLRVINEDTVQPGTGFGTHPHRDMEIITYVIEGSLEHKDSMGNGSTIMPGEIQRMSAGTGVTHSEYNASKTDLVHLIQIWIIPNKKGLDPSYEQKSILKRDNELILIGSKESTGGVVTIHQDVDLYVAYLIQNASINHIFEAGKSGWIQLVKGKIDINGQVIHAGGGASITHEEKLTIKGIDDSEFLFFKFD